MCSSLSVAGNTGSSARRRATAALREASAGGAAKRTRPGHVQAMDYLRRKLTVRAHGQSLVLVKRPIESAEHVIQKALLWARYLPQYSDLRVEVELPSPSRYK